MWGTMIGIGRECKERLRRVSSIPEKELEDMNSGIGKMDQEVGQKWKEVHRTMKEQV